jgi:hypothetical protein
MLLLGAWKLAQASVSMHLCYLGLVSFLGSSRLISVGFAVSKTSSGQAPLTPCRSGGSFFMALRMSDVVGAV